MASTTARHFDLRQSTFNDVAGNQTIHYHYGIESDRQSAEITSILKSLLPAPMDTSHREGCLYGTRTTIVNFAVEWALDPKRGSNVLWLRGLAGSGKSTVSATIANDLRRIGRLGVSIGFERGVAGKCDPSAAIRTLAHGLGLSHPQAGIAISMAVDKHPDITQMSLRQQFQHLLHCTLSAEGVIDPNSPVVVVIDALDECERCDKREVLLELLAERSKHLPVRFVITSRPDHDICGFFEHRSHILIAELAVTSHDNAHDILTYFWQQMNRIRMKSPLLRARGGWPGEEAIQKLTEQASGLFLWASVISKFIDGYNPDARIDAVLSGRMGPGAEEAFDAMYRTALGSAGNWDDEEFVADFRKTMGLILVAKHLLTAHTIDLLLKLPIAHSCVRIISQLGCVLQQHPVIRLVHPSLADFLSQRSRCIREIWFFDLNVLNSSMFIRCLKCLNLVFRKNMCNLTLSTAKVDADLPDDISYACLFWADHLCAIDETICPIVESLDEFLSQHLLHWIEAMGILQKTRNSISLLERVSSWVSKHSKHSEELCSLIRDGYRFVRRFSDNLELHPLLVYSTALLFAPSRTTLHRKYCGIALQADTFRAGHEREWSPLIQMLDCASDQVNSIAFSPDGQSLVAGLQDGTISVFDRGSGLKMVNALRGHTDSVTSVAYSPDGTLLVSGSIDCTIRVWRSNTGTLVFPPLEGHGKSVYSVAFSPDGTRFISGGGDGIVRVWDTSAGVEALEPLRGHEDRVQSVAFAPDGTLITSVSLDKSIRVWNATSGRLALPPIRSHSKWVNSVAFSPNSGLIASASDDMTIRLWNATTGVEIHPALQGHTDSVFSVAFSPDGSRLVSGSADQTVRIWDMTSGKEAISVLRGHQHWVQSVAFSPDSMSVVSGSFDRRICLWDILSDVQVLNKKEPKTESTEEFTWEPHPDTPGPSLQGAADPVYLIAFSPDGKRIVSTSHTKMVRVWDAYTGAEVLPPMRGHHLWADSIAFSLDGGRIFSTLDGEILRMWDGASGIEVHPRWSAHENWNDSKSSLCVKSDTTRPSSWEDICAWDALSELPSSTVQSDPPPPSISLANNGWITDVITGEYLAKLPPSVDWRCYCVHDRSLALGSGAGQVLVFHFPSFIES